jgi:hypothetical protein
MNDEDLATSLRSIHLTRSEHSDAASVRRDVLATRIEHIPQQRGLLQRLPRWRVGAMLGATKSVAALAIVALFVGFLLSGALMRAPSQEAGIGVGASASQQTSSKVASGNYSIPWGIGDTVHLTAPAGWWQSDDGASICQRTGEGGCPQGSRIDLTVHDVSRVVRDDVCRTDSDVFPHPHFEMVGQSVDELVWVLTHQVGTRISGPEDITLGGYPAKRLVVTLPADACPGGPEGRFLWQDTSTGPGFEVLSGGTGRIYVADVDGLRLVITSSYRDAAPEDIAQLDAIVDSIDIERGITGLDEGRHSLTVDGVSLTYSISTRVTGGWDHFGRISINKSIVGPQGAEAMIYWTSFPDGAQAQPCAEVAALPDGATASDIAATMAAAPGTELVSGPSDTTVGGRAATHVVVKVLETFGCDPGFFYTWSDIPFGPLWSTTEVGDTIRAWIVDVDSRRLVIVGEPPAGASLDPADTRLTEQMAAGLDAEIDDIIGSIRFE